MCIIDIDARNMALVRNAKNVILREGGESIIIDFRFLDCPDKPDNDKKIFCAGGNIRGRYLLNYYG